MKFHWLIVTVLTGVLLLVAAHTDQGISRLHSMEHHILHSIATIRDHHHNQLRNSLQVLQEEGDDNADPRCNDGVAAAIKNITQGRCAVELNVLLDASITSFDGAHAAASVLCHGECVAFLRQNVIGTPYMTCLTGKQRKVVEDLEVSCIQEASTGFFIGGYVLSLGLTLQCGTIDDQVRCAALSHCGWSSGLCQPLLTPSLLDPICNTLLARNNSFHKPLVITKLLDKASPLLDKASPLLDKASPLLDKASSLLSGSHSHDNLLAVVEDLDMASLLQLCPKEEGQYCAPLMLQTEAAINQEEKLHVAGADGIATTAINAMCANPVARRCFDILKNAQSVARRAKSYIRYLECFKRPHADLEGCFSELMADWDNLEHNVDPLTHDSTQLPPPRSLLNSLTHFRYLDRIVYYSELFCARDSTGTDPSGLCLVKLLKGLDVECIPKAVKDQECPTQCRTQAQTVLSTMGCCYGTIEQAYFAGQSLINTKLFNVPTESSAGGDYTLTIRGSSFNPSTVPPASAGAHIRALVGAGCDGCTIGRPGFTNIDGVDVRVDTAPGTSPWHSAFSAACGIAEADTKIAYACGNGEQTTVTETDFGLNLRWAAVQSNERLRNALIIAIMLDLSSQIGVDTYDIVQGELVQGPNVLPVTNADGSTTLEAATKFHFAIRTGFEATNLAARARLHKPQVFQLDIVGDTAAALCPDTCASSSSSFGLTSVQYPYQ